MTLGSVHQEAHVALLIESQDRAGMVQTDLATRLGKYQFVVERLESR
jgi:ribosome-binding protein aMBF1 (putative translation factor)